jgi:hypothetical protein
MATLAQKWALRHSESVRTRLAQALTDAAFDIWHEAPNARTERRRDWANAMLRSSDAAYHEAARVQWRLALNPTVAAAGEAVTDADLQYVVAAELLPYILGV